MDERSPVAGGPSSESGRVFDVDALVGTRIGERYDVVRVVFAGANTTVLDAIDVQTGRAVTLKLVDPRRSASPEFRARFDDTMRSVAALSHPNIAALYDWGVAPVGDTSAAYAVIEQLTGGSLRDMFDRGRRLSPSQALAVGLDACKALDYAHRRGFVHTELVPSKLVFGDDRRLRIIDFGLARLLGAPAWKQPESVASHVAWYSAPEQGAGQPLDGRTDVYALCLTLHEAVTGELPFKHGSTVAALAARQGKLMPVSADLGPLAAVLEHAGRPDRDDRSTAAELGRDLVRAASKLPRPEPLPLLSTGLFDMPADEMRSPDDPTGGVHRPAGGADGSGEIVVVPVDAPGDESGDDAGDDDHAGEVAAAAVVGGVAAAAVREHADEAGEQNDEHAPEEPASAEHDGDEHPGAPVIVEAEPDLDLDTGPAAGGDDLVILPLDSDIDATGPAAGTPPAAGPSPSTPPPSTVAPAAPPTATMPVAATAATPPGAERRRSAWSWIWKVLAGLVLIGAAIVGTIAAMELFATPAYEVPDLVGVQLADARAQIDGNEWVVSIENERSDEVSEPGAVVRTSPGAGTELAEGEPFLLVVSEGPVLREIPESEGELFSTAQTNLLERGLAVDFVEEFDEDVPEGSVIGWTVPADPGLVAGAMVEPGVEVLLTVSLGPEPRTVPDVRGLAVGEAQAQLGTLRLTGNQVGEEFSDDVPAGSVISQEPEPGATVERDTDVSLVASKGPDVVPFPDLSETADYLEAADVLREAGFDPRLVFGDAQGQVQTATIDGVEPEVGETFRRNSVVEIRAFDDE